MGRYTSMNTFSDTNQRTSAVPYEKATGGALADPDAKGKGSVRVPVVHNVSGSNAGVGSSGFHAYERMRRAEMARLKNMDEEHNKTVSDLEYHSKLEANWTEAEKRTRKRAEKRARRKEKQRSARGNKKRRTGSDGGLECGEGDSDEDSCDGDEAYALETSDGHGSSSNSAASSAAAPASGDEASSSSSAAAATSLDPDELLRNDGKFLERFLAAKSASAAVASLSSTEDASGPATSRSLADAPQEGKLASPASLAHADG